MFFIIKIINCPVLIVYTFSKHKVSSVVDICVVLLFCYYLHYAPKAAMWYICVSISLYFMYNI